jgi:NAD(P)-dependent dehydrogenase (short-subunit alcohol dehydrogenase family)
VLWRLLPSRTGKRPDGAFRGSSGFFAGRTAIITGANSGLGAVTARELARNGAKIIMAVRNTNKGEAAAQQITGPETGRVEVRQLDLQDLSSVRHFADGIDKADILINNAGIMAAPYALTVDGFESQIGTNHLGHFALTNLLLPKLADRVVSVSAGQHVRRPPVRPSRPHPTGPTQPGSSQRNYRRRALGAIRAAHGHQISAMRCSCANLCGRHGEGEWRLRNSSRDPHRTVIDGDRRLSRSWPCP